MKRALVIQNEVHQIGMIGDLTNVFEGIASLRIARIRDKVISSKVFFAELWHIYTQLRADPAQRLVGSSSRSAVKDLFIVITSEGGLSGDIDSKIIERVKQDYDPKTIDCIVLGSHGAILLAEMGIPIVKGYHLPESDTALEVRTIIEALSNYRNAAVYYQTYVSLGVQEVARIDLISAVKALGSDIKNTTEIISSRDYIFEPSLMEVINYMESVVLGVTLGQVILESHLAQYASRFNAMSLAKQRALDYKNELMLDYRRAKRAETDERLKEVMVSLRLL